MYPAVIALNLAGFGIVVVSQRIWRLQFIPSCEDSRSVVPQCWEWRIDNDIGRSPAGGLARGSRRVRLPTFRTCGRSWQSRGSG